MSALIPSQNRTPTGGLFSVSPGTAAERRQSNALARQTRQRLNRAPYGSRSEATSESARAFLVSHALTKVAPAGRKFYEQLIVS